MNSPQDQDALSWVLVTRRGKLLLPKTGTPQPAQQANPNTYNFQVHGVAMNYPLTQQEILPKAQPKELSYRDKLQQERRRRSRELYSAQRNKKSSNGTVSKGPSSMNDVRREALADGFVERKGGKHHNFVKYCSDGRTMHLTTSCTSSDRNGYKQAYRDLRRLRNNFSND